MIPELQLAQLYIQSELSKLGRARISYPSQEQIEKRKKELVEEVEQIIGKPLEII
jgi:hypothetical protein